MIRLFSLVASLLILVAIAACGGGDDDDSGDDAATPADETALAESMLLTVDDFPDGWSEEPSSDDEDSPFNECDPEDAEGKTGEAETGDFSDGGSATVTQEVAIFESADAASAALDGLDDVADCMVSVIDDGGLDDDTAQFSDASVEDLDVGDFGDETRAFRLSMTVHATNDDGETEEGDIFFDAVFIIVGRAGLLVQAGDALSPFPEDDLQDLLDAAVEKANDALGADSPSDETDEPDETEKPDESSGNESSEDDPIPLGDTGTVGGIADITVLDVDFDAEDYVLDEGPSNAPARDGYVMVLWNFQIENTGERTLDAYFDPGYSLIDSEGNEYDEFDYSCGSIPDQIEGSLENGETAEGDFCIQAPDDAEGLMFVVSLYDEDLEEHLGYFSLD